MVSKGRFLQSKQTKAKDTTDESGGGETVEIQLELLGECMCDEWLDLCPFWPCCCRP